MGAQQPHHWVFLWNQQVDSVESVDQQSSQLTGRAVLLGSEFQAHHLQLEITGSDTDGQMRTDLAPQVHLKRNCIVLTKTLDSRRFCRSSLFIKPSAVRSRLQFQTTSTSRSFQPSLSSEKFCVWSAKLTKSPGSSALLLTRKRRTPCITRWVIRLILFF